MEESKFLIPEESIDAIITNVSVLRKMESQLRNMFTQYHYNEVLMPSFEYVDLYTQIDCGFETEKMFQYINHEGKNVAMRLDYTVPLARLYASSHSQGEARYCYFGKVYRKELMHKGRSSESYQGGVELIGKKEIEGEKECLKMIQESLEFIPLKHKMVELGSAKFYHRIIELVGHSDELIEILKYRNISAMKDFVNRYHFEASIENLLLQLPIMFGDFHIIDRALEKLNDEILVNALQELKEIYQSLDHKEDFKFDLGMVPSMKYYTGLMIKGYCDQSAKPILSGGRYDDLLPRFDCQEGAIGFCYHMNHILNAIESEGNDND